jgi:hypothetical protein
MYSKTKERGHRYKGFLIFTTVVYDSMFEIEKHKCKFPTNDLNKILETLAILENSSINIKIANFKKEWNFSTKTLLYDISAKQTEVGKLLAGNSTPSCDKVLDECIKNCKYQNDKNGFFIFTSSDKEKCRSFCYDARRECNKNDMKKTKRSICQAKCVGYDKGNGGIFSRSDHQKCMDNCLK